MWTDIQILLHKKRNNKKKQTKKKSIYCVWIINIPRNKYNITVNNSFKYTSRTEKSDYGWGFFYGTKVHKCKLQMRLDAGINESINIGLVIGKFCCCWYCKLIISYIVKKCDYSSTISVSNIHLIFQITGDSCGDWNIRLINHTHVHISSIPNMGTIKLYGISGWFSFKQILLFHYFTETVMPSRCEWQLQKICGQFC